MSKNTSKYVYDPLSEPPHPTFQDHVLLSNGKRSYLTFETFLAACNETYHVSFVILLRLLRT